MFLFNKHLNIIDTGEKHMDMNIFVCSCKMPNCYTYNIIHKLFINSLCSQENLAILTDIGMPPDHPFEG